MFYTHQPPSGIGGSETTLKIVLHSRKNPFVLTTTIVCFAKQNGMEFCTCFNLSLLALSIYWFIAPFLADGSFHKIPPQSKQQQGGHIVYLKGQIGGWSSQTGHYFVFYLNAQSANERDESDNDDWPIHMTALTLPPSPPSLGIWRGW